MEQVLVEKCSEDDEVDYEDSEDDHAGGSKHFRCPVPDVTRGQPETSPDGAQPLHSTSLAANATDVPAPVATANYNVNRESVFQRLGPNVSTPGVACLENPLSAEDPMQSEVVAAAAGWETVKGKKSSRRRQNPHTRSLAVVMDAPVEVTTDTNQNGAARANLASSHSMNMSAGGSGGDWGTPG
ncbi:hypothetical protein H0E87_001868 [Populus deltoides]|uniref:Uncharacterized protein n=1 Tax=Populus deltoides TaxID=3696 RepID=A0A8T2ZSM9_POPDE|nr:hypothetical protein H0E87_001868 [Populus deltoides]